MIARWTLPLSCAPLQNVYARMHWAKRRKLKAECSGRMLIQNGRRSVCVPGKPVVRAVRKSTRAPDADSGYGVKLALDCLKDLGWIRDDSPRDIEFRATWEKAPPKGGALVIEIWEEAA